MPRTIKNAKIDTPSSRARLKPRREPYWTVLTQGRALGYRRLGSHGGTWIARLRNRDKQHYSALGSADDTMDSDGVSVLTHAEAQEKARTWFELKMAELHGPRESAGPYTVSQALDAYVAELGAGGGRYGGKSLPDIRRRIETRIRPRFGDKLVAELTSTAIQSWLREMANEAPRLRPATKGLGAGKIKFRDTSADPDAKRKRRHTANKVLTVLKAALNLAFNNERVVDDKAWRRVKPFKGVDVAKIRYLTHDECVRLVNTATPDFRKLVRAALYTGARYGEITRFRVNDFDPDNASVHVRVSKSGEERHIHLDDEGRRFFEAMTAGRKGAEIIFLRNDGEPWRGSHQIRPMNEANDRAGISPRASFHVLRHTYASHAIMRGTPIIVVSRALGHSTTKITEKHYGHLTPDYIAAAIRAGVLPLGFQDEMPVKPLHPLVVAK